MAATAPEPAPEAVLPPTIAILGTRSPPRSQRPLRSLSPLLAPVKQRSSVTLLSTERWMSTLSFPTPSSGPADEGDSPGEEEEEEEEPQLRSKTDDDDPVKSGPARRRRLRALVPLIRDEARSALRRTAGAQLVCVALAVLQLELARAADAEALWVHDPALTADKRDALLAALLAARVAGSAATAWLLLQLVRLHSLVLCEQIGRGRVPPGTPLWLGPARGALAADLALALLHPFPRVDAVGGETLMLWLSAAPVARLVPLALLAARLHCAASQEAMRGGGLSGTVRVEADSGTALRLLVQLHPVRALAGGVAFAVLAGAYAVYAANGLAGSQAAPLDRCLALALLTVAGVGGDEAGWRPAPAARCALLLLGALGVALKGLAAWGAIRWLELSRPEALVIDYTRSLDVNARVRHTAATLIQRAWRLQAAAGAATLWRNGHVEGLHYRTASERVPCERRFYVTLRRWRHVRRGARLAHLNVSGVTVRESIIQAATANMAEAASRLRAMLSALAEPLPRRRLLLRAQQLRARDPSVIDDPRLAWTEALERRAMECCVAAERVSSLSRTHAAAAGAAGRSRQDSGQPSHEVRLPPLAGRS